MPKIYFVGVDVGTSSARAALVTSDGKVLKQFVKNITIWNTEHEHYEQSSNDIWHAVCVCVKEVTSVVPREEIVAISFDATCSLVVLGANGEPLSVSKTGNPEQNVILWMDHRAHEEAKIINTTEHQLLRHVGGQVSVEMEMPKLLWLKRHMYLSTWSKIWRAFDLPDYLTWRATECDSRSLCAVACKWNYDAMQNRWNDEFLQSVGLGDLCENNYAIIGSRIQEPGEPVGKGLTERAAYELNLLPGTIVGTSLIDAHAGALGLLGCQPGQSGKNSTKHESNDVGQKLALICGTSSCHMSLTREPCWSTGVWGPYKGAILPEYFLNEAGQSATGLLLDHMIKTHPQYMHIKMKLRDNEHIYSYLNRRLFEMASGQGLEDPCFLTKDLHVWPDYHGNRSPIADPNLKGMVSGLTMHVDEQSLTILYLAVVQALAYGTRYIIETLMHHKRPAFTSLAFCGGLSKNPLYVQTHADACNLAALVPNEPEMVLVGSAMLGACAAKVYANLEEASKSMGGSGLMLKPNPLTQAYHMRKYKVFLEMLTDQRKYSSLMESTE